MVSRAVCAVAACGLASALAPPAVSLGDFVVQRAIQQQLYFSAELRMDVVANWLANFGDHEHLESAGRPKGGPGFPGTYSAAFGQLRTTPYTEYLAALGTAPNSVVEVSFPKPKRRLSARELKNPFLAAQAAEAADDLDVMDVPIEPRAILSRLLTTADEQADTWAFHLGELELDDVERINNDRAEAKGLPTAEMLRAAEMAEGGETAVSWYTDDEPLPLNAFDCRACERLVTLRALAALKAELRALTPTNAFEKDYLRKEARADDDDEDVDARVIERRRVRRERREAGFVSGGDDDRASAAVEAALAFLDEFGAYWVPKLAKGDERSALQKRATRPPPGMKERPRPEGAGADADAAMEDLWAYRDESPYHIRGGELVVPAMLGARLRELRSGEAAEASAELKDTILPELKRARIQHTDYTEEDERIRLEKVEKEKAAALDWRSAEWDD